MIKDLLQSCAVAFGMYSKVPMLHFEWNKKNMRYAMCFFPLIGAVIGAAQLLWLYLVQYLHVSTNLRAAVLLVLPVAISGGIHVDGLLDTADALSSWKTKEEKLEILKDSHCGAFAIIVGICYFILDFGAASQIDFDRMKVLALGYVISRAWSGLGVVVLTKAKNTGLLRTFSDGAQKRNVAITMVIVLIAASIGAIAIDPLRGSVMVALSAIVYLWYRHLAYDRFGGITGDTNGFLLQITELIMMIGVGVL